MIFVFPGSLAVILSVEREAIAHECSALARFERRVTDILIGGGPRDIECVHYIRH